MMFVKFEWLIALVPRKCLHCDQALGQRILVHSRMHRGSTKAPLDSGIYLMKYLHHKG